MSFVFDILEFNDEINEKYREKSKLPKFIRRILISYYKKKLLKIVNKINPENIPVDAIYDLASIINIHCDNGTYKNLRCSHLSLYSSSEAYNMQMYILLDGKIDITADIEIVHKESNYDLKLKIFTWNQNGKNKNIYHTSFNKYQALSMVACNELAASGYYSKYRQAVFVEVLKTLYDNMTSYLTEEITKKGTINYG